MGPSDNRTTRSNVPYRPRPTDGESVDWLLFYRMFDNAGLALDTFKRIYPKLYASDPEVYQLAIYRYYGRPYRYAPNTRFRKDGTRYYEGQRPVHDPFDKMEDEVGVSQPILPIIKLEPYEHIPSYPEQMDIGDLEAIATMYNEGRGLCMITDASGTASLL